MSVTTIHKYLNQRPFKTTDTRMILGTIHPHLVNDFKIDFFYGNRGSLWSILNDAFPKYDFSHRETIIPILDRYNIFVTDIIQQCDREHEKITEDSKLYNLKTNELQIKKALLNSKIETIYFTSRFSKNNAAKLFCKLFDIKHSETFDENKSEFTIPSTYFGRVIKGIVLYSPSDSSNISIPRTQPFKDKRDYYKSKSETPIKLFKIEFYKEKFHFLNN